MGITDHSTCLLRNLFAGQEATVKTKHGTTGWFQIGKGVCQGYILLSCLFNFYVKYIMQNAGLGSRLLGEISITSDTQMAETYGRKCRRIKESLDEGERGEWKSWLKNRHSKNLRSWHTVSSLHGKYVEKQWKRFRLYLLELQNHCRWLQSWNQKTFAPWKKSYNQPKQYIKKQKYYFHDKGLSSQSYGFSSSHVWMWELDHKEKLIVEEWCFWTVVLEKTLQSLLVSKEIKPVHPKRNQSWIFIGQTNAEDEMPILWPSDAKNWLLGKTLMLGKIEGRRRMEWQRMRWLMASSTRWTWVWDNSGR